MGLRRTAIASVIEQVDAGPQGMAAPWAHLAAAELHNGLARYEEAAAAARQAAASTFDPWNSLWALPELVEAAARAGDRELARDALGRLAETTRPSGTDLALGLESRCRALLSEGETAEHLYEEAIDHLGRGLVRTELARAHTCSTASGFAASAVEWTLASSYGVPMTPSSRWAQKASRSARVESWWPLARSSAGTASRRVTSSRLRKSRSHASLAMV
jgi:tetratricopeptide (TPR) repeat protein